MKKGIPIIFIGLILTLKLVALDPFRLITQYKNEIWKDENGLPQNFIGAILQTSDGYLWIGTEEGLVRFDGVKFKIFDDTNTVEIKDNYISSLAEDGNQNLWIGTRSGLLKYKNNTFTLFTKKNGLPSNTIYTIYNDPNQDMWIGTHEGLVKYRNNTFTFFGFEHNLVDDKVNAIYMDKSKRLWIGTRKGICSFFNNTFTCYSKKDGIPNIRIKSFHEDLEGNLLVGTHAGLYKLENGTFSKFTTKSGPLDDRVYDILMDRDKNVWIGTITHGLLRYKNGIFSKLSRDNGLSDNAIISMTEDREGCLWVGTAFGGLNCLKDGKLKVIGKREGLSDDIIFSIYEDSRGYLWIGTNHGLNRLKDEKPIIFDGSNGLSNNVINVIFEDHQGSIWVGTDDGLNQLRNLPLKITKRRELLRGYYIVSIFEDSSNNLWIGTHKGLLILKGNRMEEVTQEDWLTSNNITFIHQDRGKNIFIGTYRGGLIKCKNGNYTYYNEKSGLVTDTLSSIYEDNEGVLWIGSIKGLIRIKNEIITNYTKKEGMFDNNIYKVLEDSKGYLWMSCNKGIFRVSKEELIQFAEGKIGRVHSIVYGKDEGMRSSECNGGFQFAGCRTKDGRLLFPTIKGVVIVEPEKIAINKIPPPVMIEKVLLDGREIELTDLIEVKPGTHRIEIFYTALSFITPKKVKFKYRLQGFEDDWIYIDRPRDRVATYTNLSAGNYTFQVLASNNDGIWNEKGTSINFKIIPPVWETWWFRVVILVIFAIISYFIIGFFRRYVTFSTFWKKQKYVGQFKLLEKIGGGGMGTIYKAHNLMDKSETVAVKVLKEELFLDENHRKRFIQEAAIIDQLTHPNIINIIERGQHKQRLFIAMELLEGNTLENKIWLEGKLDIKESLVIMIQITDALVKIHSKNIVHRDLKPANIMLIEKGGNPNFVKLLDFGLAKMEYQSRITETGMVLGTLSYMAPEQISKSEFSAASDIFSLGAIFYEMTTGHKPFPGEIPTQLMKQILESEPIRPIKLQPQIPDELNNLIIKMLQKNKELRPHVEVVLSLLRKLNDELS